MTKKKKKQNGRELLQEGARMEVPQTVSLCWDRLAKKGTLGSKAEPALPAAAYVQTKTILDPCSVPVMLSKK